MATSFVYTPSECIKQRCQVTGATSSFAAAKSVVRADGVLGLYKGWSAVLCRNMPQSAIKFFVFEQLMRAAGGALASGGGSSGTLPALAIGGVAGSTAAMFTTPFDTIKTRMQTAGVVNQGGSTMRGLLPTMRDIVVNEEWAVCTVVSYRGCSFTSRRALYSSVLTSWRETPYLLRLKRGERRTSWRRNRLIIPWH